MYIVFLTAIENMFLLAIYEITKISCSFSYLICTAGGLYSGSNVTTVASLVLG